MTCSLISWEAVTAFAASLGLVAVALQLHWVRKQMRLQLYGDYTKRYQEIMLQLPEGVRGERFCLNSLPFEKRERTMRYIRAYFDLCFEEWDLNRCNLIDRDFWRVWDSSMKVAFARPVAQHAWSLIKVDSHFPADFQRFVERAMSDGADKRQ